MALLQESLAVATRTGAAKPADFRQVIIDTTVQEKAITFPTDAKLMHRARERLVRLAKATRGRPAPVLCAGRQAGADPAPALCPCQAVQPGEPQRSGACAPCSGGSSATSPARSPRRRAPKVFARPLSLARRVREQRQRERGRKIYSLHAPEVECIGKGKAHKPYEFGVKVSVATPLNRCRGGQFVAHVKALPGNPYDGHTLATVIPAIEATIGAELARVDHGCRLQGPPCARGEALPGLCGGARSAGCHRPSSVPSGAAPQWSR